MARTRGALLGTLVGNLLLLFGVCCCNAWTVSRVSDRRVQYYIPEEYVYRVPTTNKHGSTIIQSNPLAIGNSTANQTALLTKSKLNILRQHLNKTATVFTLSDFTQFNATKSQAQIYYNQSATTNSTTNVSTSASSAVHAANLARSDVAVTYGVRTNSLEEEDIFIVIPNSLPQPFDNTVGNLHNGIYLENVAEIDTAFNAAKQSSSSTVIRGTIPLCTFMQEAEPSGYFLQQNRIWSNGDTSNYDFLFTKAALRLRAPLEGFDSSTVGKSLSFHVGFPQLGKYRKHTATINTKFLYKEQVSNNVYPRTWDSVMLLNAPDSTELTEAINSRRAAASTTEFDDLVTAGVQVEFVFTAETGDLHNDWTFDILNMQSVVYMQTSDVYPVTHTINFEKFARYKFLRADFIDPTAVDDNAAFKKTEQTCIGTPYTATQCTLYEIDSEDDLILYNIEDIDVYYLHQGKVEDAATLATYTTEIRGITHSTTTPWWTDTAFTSKCGYFNGAQFTKHPVDPNLLTKLTTAADGIKLRFPFSVTALFASVDFRQLDPAALDFSSTVAAVDVFYTSAFSTSFLQKLNFDNLVSATMLFRTCVFVHSGTGVTNWETFRLPQFPNLVNLYGLILDNAAVVSLPAVVVVATEDLNEGCAITYESSADTAQTLLYRVLTAHNDHFIAPNLRSFPPSNDYYFFQNTLTFYPEVQNVNCFKTASKTITTVEGLTLQTSEHTAVKDVALPFHCAAKHVLFELQHAWEPKLLAAYYAESKNPLSGDDTLHQAVCPPFKGVPTRKYLDAAPPNNVTVDVPVETKDQRYTHATIGLGICGGVLMFFTVAGAMHLGSVVSEARSFKRAVKAKARLI